MNFDKLDRAQRNYDREEPKDASIDDDWPPYNYRLPRKLTDADVENFIKALVEKSVIYDGLSGAAIPVDPLYLAVAQVWVRRPFAMTGAVSAVVMEVFWEWAKASAVKHCY